MSSFQHQHPLETSRGFGKDLRASYKWDWSALIKNKEISREEYITGMLEVTIMEGYLMEGYASREPFDFVMSVPSSTRRTVTLGSWLLCNESWLPCSYLLTYFLLSFHMFFLFDFFLHKNYKWLYQQLDKITTFMPIRLYKWRDLSFKKAFPLFC